MSKKIQLIFCVSNDLSYDKRIQKICKTLSDNGFSVVLVGRKFKNSIPYTAANYNFYQFACLFNKGKLFYIEFNFRVFIYLLFSKADVFVANDLDTIIPVYFSSLLRRKKRAFDAHEYFEEVPEVINRKGIKYFWTCVAHFFIPLFTVRYTTTASLVKIFKVKYKSSFELIRNVPYPLKSSNTISKKYLVYIGALNKGRGLEFLIEAMQFIDGYLKIIGEGDLSKELRSLAKKLNVEHKIEFAGYVVPDKINEYLEEAVLGFNLLEAESKNYYYSLANKCFDYIQAEVPVIQMNFPEYQKINQRFEVAVLINQLNPKTIAAEVNSILENEELYNKLKNNCKKAKLVFNWDIESKKLLEIYQVFKK